MTTAVVIIPARYASTRLPGKAIREEAKTITGKYLIEHVYDRAKLATRISRVIVATDDERILNVVKGFGGEAVMTSPDHPSGTDRIAEVAAGLDTPIIVNVQGDEPEIHPDMIDSVVGMLEEDESAHMATLANEISTEEELNDPNCVKVIVDKRGYAIYFSRYPIPYLRDSGGVPRLGEFRYLRHIGLYGYRREFLLRYCELPPSSLELAERLEQLRAIENGYRIRVEVTPHRSMGVDTQKDFEQFLRKFAKK